MLNCISEQRLDANPSVCSESARAAAPWLIWIATGLFFAFVALRPADAADSIERIVSTDQFPPGSWAAGTFGDWRIDCGSAVWIVAGVEASVDRPFSPGVALDALCGPKPFDQMEQIAPIAYPGGEGPAPLLFSSESIERDAQGQALALTLEGAVEGAPALKASARYVPGGHPGTLSVTTRLENASSDTLYNIGVGDRAAWALFIPLVENLGVPNALSVERTSTRWIGGTIDRQILGIVCPAGMIEGAHSGGTSLLRYATQYELKPGQSVSVERLFFAAEAAFSVFTDFALEARGDARGTLRGGPLMDGTTGQPLADVDVAIESLGDESINARLPYTLARTDAKGEFAVQLPAGIKALSRGRATWRYIPPFPLAPLIEDGKTHSAGGMNASPLTTLRLSVVDADTQQPIPAKVQIFAVGGGALRIDYGPAYATRGSRNVWHLPNGDAEIPVPYSGRYEAIVTRGIEYSLERFSFVSRAGQAIEQKVALKRLLDTSGYLAVDFGARTEATPNGRIAAEDLVVAAACEGVEWLVSGDANRAVDLRPAIESEGLSQWLGASRGMRLKPRTRPFGADFMVFPMPEALLAGGADFRPDWLENAAPGEALRRLREGFPGSLLAVNAPLIPGIGYFQSNYDAADSIDGAPFEYGFDLFEMLDGHYIAPPDGNLNVFSNLAWRGALAVPYAGSSSTEIYGNEPGYPRTYVGVSDDNPASVSEADIVNSLRLGDVVATNGPFIRLRVNGKRPGELVRLAPGETTLKVEMEVWAAPFVDVAEFRVYRDNQFHYQRYRPPVEEALRYPLASQKETREVEVYPSRGNDITLQAMVFGKRGPMPAIPDMAGRSERDFRAFAITGMVYVDGDGDGKYTPPPDRKPRF